MKHIKISFSSIDEALKEILIAVLSDAGFEGFEEAENNLHAYVNAEQYDADTVAKIAATLQQSYTTEVIDEQNWNSEWEKSFEPVIVEGFCTVRADFHQLSSTTPYDIIVTPKMSFGTGHHATTQLMILQMKDLVFADKHILDFGTGTGILAILADKLGAQKILAIDNDEWSYRNALENVSRNNCTHIAVNVGSLEDVKEQNFDIVLANINRHVLLQYMKDMFLMLNVPGQLLLSGLLIEDEVIVKKSAMEAGFKFIEISSLNNWIAMLFEKK